MGVNPMSEVGMVRPKQARFSPELHLNIHQEDPSYEKKKT
jgi:hypothetical protein